MKKTKFAIAGIVALTLGLGSCIEHEVIPAPEPTVDLSCHFQGVINGTNAEFTENVLGYSCTSTKAKIILPAPSFSSAVYYSEMSSTQTPVSIKIGLGSVFWDASVAAEPTLTLFNNFHLNNTTPVFSNGAASGFEVTYRDASGTIWVSKQNSVNFQDVTFSGIKQESDASGDYSKFTCDFDCYVYHQDAVTLLWDSLPIQNAELIGWFKR